MMGCTSSLCVTSSHLTHNSTWSLVSLSCRDDEIINCTSHLAICSSSSQLTRTLLVHFSLLWMKYTICNLYVLLCSLPHITSYLNWTIIGDKKTQLSLDSFNSNVYTILMVSRQAVVFTEEIKFQPRWRHWLIWFQWNSIPFKVQNSTATVTMVEVTVYCFFETTLSLTQVGGGAYLSFASWFCPDVADVLMSPMSRCRRTQDFPQVSCLPPMAPVMSLISRSRFPTDSARPSNRPATSAWWFMWTPSFLTLVALYLQLVLNRDPIMCKGRHCSLVSFPIPLVLENF